MRIYIVDDDAESKSSVHKRNFETIIRNLHLHGHSVTCEAYLEKAYNHLISHSNKFRYDLILVDHLFPNHFQSGRFVNSKSDIDNGTGAFLCGELSKKELLTPIVLFTATGKDPDNIRKVLGDYGICYFFDKDEFNNSAIIKTTTLPGFKRIQEIRQNRIEKALKVFFKNLSDKQLKAFEDECKKGLTADWTRPELFIELEGGNYTALELLTDPSSTLDLNSTNDKIKAFIAKYKRRYKFHGENFDTEHVYVFLKNYLEASNYDNKSREINIRALNYMLDVLHVRDKMEDNEYGGSEIFQLNTENRKLRAASACNSEVRFHEKLVLRRVALGFESLVGFENVNFFNKKVLAALLRDGTTNTVQDPRDKKKEKSEIKTTPIFGTALGLGVDYSSKCFITSDYTVLKEELDWIQGFGKAAIEMRKYLNALSSDSEMAKTPKIKIDFSDFYSFQDYLLKLKGKKNTLTFAEMVEDEKQNAIDELFEPVSLSLILDFYNTL